MYYTVGQQQQLSRSQIIEQAKEIEANALQFMRTWNTQYAQEMGTLSAIVQIFNFIYYITIPIFTYNIF